MSKRPKDKASAGESQKPTGTSSTGTKITSDKGKLQSDGGSGTDSTGVKGVLPDVGDGGKAK
jgi:hypothetical protein